MTEERAPEAAPAPLDPPPAEPAQASSDMPGPDVAPARQPGGRRPVIILAAIGVLLAGVLFAVRNNVSADDLEVGTCFNIPNGTTVQTVERQPCNESHNAEVFFVGTYDGESFPIALSLDSYIDDNCVPAFATYVGTDIGSAADLTIGYFHPSRDGWDGGDRTITCYVAHTDERQITQSLRGSSSP